MASNDNHRTDASETRPRPRPPATLPATPPPGFALPEKRSPLMSAIVKHLGRRSSTADGVR